MHQILIKRPVEAELADYIGQTVKLLPGTWHEVADIDTNERGTTVYVTLTVMLHDPDGGDFELLETEGD